MKESTKIKAKEWYEKNKARKMKTNAIWQAKNRDKFKDYKLRARYGITMEDYKKLHELQKGLCKICERQKQLMVDHCHKTGKIRGLLCGKCNKGLGHFLDNREYLKSAIEYLGENNGN